MLPDIRRLGGELKACLLRFRADDSGNIAVIFGIVGIAIFVAVGAGVDLSRAYAARQRLSQVATLACQFSTRPSVVQTANSTYTGTNGFQTYVNAVNSFATASLSTQHWSSVSPVGPTGTAGAYFTATPATAPSASASAGVTGPTNASVELAANIPTTLMRIVNVAQIPVHARINCQPPATAPEIINPPTILKEGFETPCSGWCFKTPTGSSAFLPSPISTFPSDPTYTGSNGTKWYITGYCLETDETGNVNATSPEGSHTAELDCDNGSNSAGNSSITTKLYLAAGNYELRYYYRSRIDYPDYNPTYICGSTASDVSWANSTNSNSTNIPANSLRTNQINVYLDEALNNAAPLHNTMFNNQKLAGVNLIDMCVYSPDWVERSVRIKVTTPAYYWLSFAADGANDSFGGQLDSIRLCQGSCPGSLQDNFPDTWAAANNGNSNKLLFEDTFDTPVYTQDQPNAHYIAKGGNLNLSLGTSGSASGWPNLAASGWATGPFNQITYALAGAYQGAQYIALDGYNQNGNALRNRLISRPFLLDPGYYQVRYDYISMVTFPGATAQFCYTPYTGLSLTPQATATGQIRYYNTINTSYDTNIVGLFMSNSQMTSTPIGGGAQSSQTSFLNTDGTTSTTPNLSPDAVNWNSYNAAQVNPALDVCGYSPNWVVRTVAVKITKPGYYWMTFSANGSTADGNGGAIDDVTLTALGSPYMSNPPSNALTAIPVPNPQPDTLYSPGTYPGYSIVAAPFTPPAAMQ